MKTFDLFGDFVDAFLFRNDYASSKKADDVNDTNTKSDLEENESTEERKPVNGSPFMSFTDFFDLFSSFGDVVPAESVKPKETKDCPVEEEETKECAHEVDLPEENEVRENEQEKVQEASDSDSSNSNVSNGQNLIVLDKNGITLNFKIPEEFDYISMIDMHLDVTELSLVIKIKKITESKEVSYEIRHKLNAE